MSLWTSSCSFLLAVLYGVPGQRGIYGCVEGPDAWSNNVDAGQQSGGCRRWNTGHQVCQPACNQSPGEV